MGAVIFTAENFLLSIVLIAAVITDIRSHRIPNWLTLPAVIMGLGINFISTGPGGLLSGIEGLFLGIGLFIVLYIMGGMGAGDVKLMGAVGAIVGPRMVLMAALYTTIAGGIYAIAVILFHPGAKGVRAALGETVKNFIYYRSFKYIRPANTPEPQKLCYGVAIAVGTVTAVLLNSLKL